MIEHKPSPESYLNSTEPAVQHMFTALQIYNQLTPRPSLEPYRMKDGVITLSAEQAIGYLKNEIDAMSLDLAKATLCGAILQVAYAGIKQNSSNSVVPDSCQHFSISPTSPNVKFCIGRQVHGIPIGIIIYAARVQYNHWEDGTPSNPTAKGVFHHLLAVRYNDMKYDMVYELDWPCPRPVAHHILQLELKWNVYQDYATDMREMMK